MFTKYFASLCLLVTIIAAPASNSVDTSSHCGKFDTVEASQYSLLLDQWGSANATSGSACASVTSSTSTTVSWVTKWNWVGGAGIKSFTHVRLTSGLNKQLSAIKSMPTVWDWSDAPSGNVVANVVYDLFMSSTSGGGTSDEVMIWLGNFNAGPISANFNADGAAVAIATNIALADQQWNLYFGSNGGNNVFSFLLAGNGQLTNFNGDLNVFLEFLTSTGRINAARFLTAAQAGTEATSGSATFTTSTYSLAIN